MNREYSLIYILFSLFCAYSSYVSGQTYGLEFQGQTFTLDNRTELNLTPDGFLKFQEEFEISFDYKIEPIVPNANFGYVFRIINSENHNVDLLSTPSPVLRLNIVAGKNNSYIPVDFPLDLVGKWIHLRIKFLMADDRLIFYTPDSMYVSEGIGFKEKDEFKIIFGANDFNQFKTTDVPSMSIKNLEISEKGILKYAWYLDEREGFIARDRINRQEAHVKNPVWLKLTHQVWQPEFEKVADGAVMVAFDERNERIFIVGTDELWIYSAEDNPVRQIRYNNKLNLNPNTYCAIYNSSDDRIYCYIADGESVFSIDIESGEWIQHDTAFQSETGFRHHNRFYRPSDNSLYLFGGYGFHKYNNNIRKIDLTTLSAENLPGNNAVFNPRYLAGLGELNDTVYILGGYGSTTGDQLINPHSYYDLFGYSLKNGSLFKKFEIPRIIDDMALANTLWIDPGTRDYYALIFEKSKFDGYLQLVRGNLDAPVIETAGNRIPFQFLDVRSHASLFYLKAQKKFFSYTWIVGANY